MDPYFGQCAKLQLRRYEGGKTMNMRTKHSPVFKVKVALEALKEEKPSAELASTYQVHPGLIRNWKDHILKSLPDLFNGKRWTYKA
jgi:transposase-like protein